MKSEWIKMISQITNNIDNINELKCPNCEKKGIDYLYVGDKETRVGFLQIWCSKCLKGIYISRAIAPINAKFASFEADLKDIVPQCDFQN